jgi:taurine dioxygenase
MDYQSIRVEPLSSVLGAVIHDADLAQLDDAMFAQIHAAWLKHQVIFFRDQTITPAQQLAFAKRLGDIHFHPFMRGMDEFPEILEIIREPGDEYTFGSNWHTDQMFNPKPAKATMLYAKETPSSGGDTLFASMYAAFDGLSETMQTMLRGVNGWNLGDRPNSNRTKRYAGNKSMAAKMRDPGDLQTESAHPLVRTHPETRRAGLYVGGHTAAIHGLHKAESEPLLGFLKEHSTQPEYLCRFNWEPGSLALWDNRCVQHRALSDYNERRHMHRITIAGDTPF